MKNFLKIKKERDLGEIISDTFQFLRGEYKILFKLILKITWPALLLFLLSYGFYLFSLQDIFEFSSNSAGGFFGFASVALLLFDAFIMIAVSIVFYALLNGAVLGSIKSYAKNEGEIIEAEVKEETRLKFWRLIGAGVLSSLFVFVGFVFFIIPGVYLMVPLAMMAPIVVFQDKGVSEALNECFQLIKDNWWVTFATILVIGILFYILFTILRLPYTIYSMVKMFTAFESGASDPSFMFDGISISLNLFFTLIQQIISGVIVISMGLIFYNLNEKKNFTGAYEEIENLGEDHE